MGFFFSNDISYANFSFKNDTIFKYAVIREEIPEITSTVEPIQSLFSGDSKK